MSTTNQASPFDYTGVEIFKEDLDENMKWLAKNLELVPNWRRDFVTSVVDYWKVREQISDKQINAILPGFREAQNAEAKEERSDRREVESYRELDGKPSFKRR